MSRSKKLSHALSRVLRHAAVEQGLEVRPDGFVPLGALLACRALRGLRATPEEVAEVVRVCRKQRFALRDGMIRANQGHSGAVAARLNDEAMLDDIHVAAHCVHGTTRAAWEGGIRDGGLSRMRRRHVHFSERPFGDAEIVSGMRNTSQVLVHVDVAAARAAGIRFFRSANGVILSAGVDGVIPPHLFSRVEEVVGGAARPMPGWERRRAPE